MLTDRDAGDLIIVTSYIWNVIITHCMEQPLQEAAGEYKFKRTIMESFDALLKVVIIGDSCVGKTCLILRYTQDIFRENFLSTIGEDETCHVRWYVGC